ncbi:MAG: 3-deoxy-manno-octulosonate cytidylyltransferase [Candidatus Rokubacteria bacterium]|nr:3-deoxy-manno-octulosonate cytidylyltransferase [Candidatus Rokubacteria bacterium]
MGLSTLGVIPARLVSTRLPRKVLREIEGRPLIWHVWEAVRRAACLDAVVVATDSREVADACAALRMEAMLTSPDHPSGTDRVWEVAQTRAADVYVNVQGDEPLVTRGHLERLLRPFRARPDTQVSTLMIRAADDELPKPHVNKVVRGLDGHALYFSKYPIPFDRDGRGTFRFKHIGLYAYRAAALDHFHRLPPSPLEQAERLEQLRFLEHGVAVVVVSPTSARSGSRRSRRSSARSSVSR